MNDARWGNDAFLLMINETDSLDINWVKNLFFLPPPHDESRLEDSRKKGEENKIKIFSSPGEK